MASQSRKLTYLAGSPEGEIQVKNSVRAIGGMEVLVRVTHSGLCGTDVHDRTAGCGLGHEGIGFVEKKGAEVTAVEIGQRVGWGWQLSSCGHCRECISGYRQYCPESKGQKYGELEQGAFGDYVVKHQEFVYPIPVEIESKFAGPLNCAGQSLIDLQITVYEALHVAGSKPSDCIGVVGLGGLGHLAVLYARAMGCDVVVFSGSESKRADAMALGATEFCLLPREGGPIHNLKAGINVLLLCGGELPNFEVSSDYHKSASTEASRQNHIDALAFAARHGIKPWIEEFPMSAEGLRNALTALESGKVRYRAVLSTEVEGGGHLS
ncbi:NADP-dependent alcohol dehydrogenase [Lachnellula hyalina]|uniref:NADP-dependent alcohol dehydrogenase n=1 Tax=Lachnellula hyalina TaxID=1316788 RepID=A0A8H8R6U8_9HELO|nr:NADP-dependent alcohol dehydrogenase [Lachnellula hyalina]TVY28775.1 NADP-dependent alcohol dehydrogenase [Lachnellula hyalina]